MAEDAAILEETLVSPVGDGGNAADSGGDGNQVAGTTGEPEPAAGAAVEVGGPPPPQIEVEYPDEEPEDAPTANAKEAESETDSKAELAPEASGSARFGTGALTRILKEHPELAKAAEGVPRVKAQLYQMARRSQELAEYQDLVPSISRAREAVEAQHTLAAMDEKYYAAEPGAFWQGLHQASGTSGAYERNVRFLQETFLDAVAQRAAANKNEDIGKAVTAIRETLGWDDSRAPRSRAEEGRTAHDASSLPLHIRKELEELGQLRLRRSQEEQQATSTFLDGTAKEAGQEMRAFVDGILANTGFSDYDKQNIARDFVEKVAELADQDKVHNAALEELYRAGGANPGTRAQMVARVKAWARQNGRDILEPILKHAGAGLKQRQSQAEAVRARRRSEPTSSGTASRPVQTSARDLVKQAEGKLGRRLSDREILELA